MWRNENEINLISAVHPSTSLAGLSCNNRQVKHDLSGLAPISFDIGSWGDTIIIPVYEVHFVLIPWESVFASLEGR